MKKKKNDVTKLVHSIINATYPDWDGIGTHANSGTGPCKVDGALTDCISNINCSLCQDMLNERVEIRNSEYIQKEWAKSRIEVKR